MTGQKLKTPGIDSVYDSVGLYSQALHICRDYAQSPVLVVFPFLLSSSRASICECK